MKAGKIIAIGILALIAVFVGIPMITGLIGGVLALILKLAIPAAIVLGVLYAIYRISGADKSLPGSGKSLP